MGDPTKQKLSLCFSRRRRLSANRAEFWAFLVEGRNLGASPAWQWLGSHALECPERAAQQH